MAANIAEITNDNFETKVLKSEKPIMIDLWAEWCMPCKMLTPVIEEIAEEYKGRVDVAKVNVDDSPELATELSVMSIPTLIFFKKGKEAGRLTGVNTKEYIIGKIKEFFSL
ncbi:MAG: thioredoxin [Candidatus Omnitrophica bacterium]|nr:thioredoxin [Candidatus Omnitrophota bacterium]